MIRSAIPNILTCGNVVVGILGIINVFQGEPQYTLYFVVAAAFFDFLDGFAARALKVQSPMGKELDSLADMVSFSALPTLYLYVHTLILGYSWAAYVALLVAPFSALRLAKFNIDSNQGDKFIGVPTPANAIFIGSLGFAQLQLPEFGWIAIGLASSFMLVVPMEMIALKFKNYTVADNWPRFLLVLVIFLLIATLGMSGLVWVIPTYIVLSIATNFIGRRRSMGSSQ